MERVMARFRAAIELREAMIAMQRTLAVANTAITLIGARGPASADELEARLATILKGNRPSADST